MKNILIEQIILLYKEGIKISFTTISKVRKITNDKLTSTMISDDDLCEIILQATAKINSLVNIYVREETVKYIDEVRKNKYADGTTTIFYVKNGLTNYLSDMNNDGEVTITDVKVYKIDSDNLRTELIVSSIDIENGSFTLSAAPGTDTQTLLVWYAFSYYNVSTPDKLIELLTSYLSASFAYLQKDHSLSNKNKFGNIEISRAQGSTSYQKYKESYLELLKQISTPLNRPRLGEYKYLI